MNGAMKMVVFVFLLILVVVAGTVTACGREQDERPRVLCYQECMA